jgi:hypothetical protein
MARVVLQPFWQQKHPTPSNRAWEFHFHPADLSPAVTQAIVAMDVGLSGDPQSAWIVAPEYLVWARTFVAQVPSEQRAYVGLAGVVVSGDLAAAFPGALEAVAERLPPAAPLAAGAGAGAGASVGPRTVEARHADLVDPEWPLGGEVETARAVAQALTRGGVAQLSDPLDAGLAALTGRLLTWLPPRDRVAARRGALSGGRGRALTAESPQVENLLHYLAAAWAPGPELQRRHAGLPRATFQLLHEICAATSRSLWDVFGDLGRMADAWDTAPRLSAWLRENVIAAEETRACDAQAPAPLFDESERDAGMLWNRVLHYFGRGHLRGEGMAQRLATVLACRVAIDHLVTLDDPGAAGMPARYLRRLRYEALLPRAARDLLGAELARAAPALGGLA